MRWAPAVRDERYGTREAIGLQDSKQIQMRSMLLGDGRLPALFAAGGTVLPNQLVDAPEGLQQLLRFRRVRLDEIAKEVGPAEFFSTAWKR